MTESRITDETNLIIVLFNQTRWWSSVRSSRRRAFRRRMLNARGKAKVHRPPRLPAVSGPQTLFPFGPLKACISLSYVLAMGSCLLKRLRIEKT